MPRLPGPGRDVQGLHTLTALSTGKVSAARLTRGAGEVVWRQPNHRIVQPLSGLDGRRVTVDGGRVKEFRWQGELGFYPAGTETRTVAGAATSFHLVWTPDPETAGRLERLNPFEDRLIAVCAEAIARELDSDAPDRLLLESLTNAIVVKMMRHFVPASEVETPRKSGLSRDRLSRLVEYVDAHLGDDLTLDALAAIAWTVGFESQAAFTTRFRQEVGQPPSSLRRDRH
jgi:AraC-like DNA-binding protein